MHFDPVSSHSMLNRGSTTMLPFTVMSTPPPFPSYLFWRVRSLLSFIIESNSTMMTISGSSHPSIWSSVALFPLTLLLFVPSHWVLRNYGSCFRWLSTRMGLVQSQLPGRWYVSVWQMVPHCLVRVSWVLDAILEWLNSTELMFHNWGTSQSSTTYVRDYGPT